MRRHALAALLVLAACPDGGADDGDASGSTSLGGLTDGPVCGNGVVEADEACDGQVAAEVPNCDEWCQPAAYIFGGPAGAGDVLSYYWASGHCDVGTLIGEPPHQYLPYFGSPQDQGMQPLVGQGYSSTCQYPELPGPAKAQSLAELSELTASDLCNIIGENLGAYQDVWVEPCEGEGAGPAKVRSPDGVVREIPCDLTNAYKAVLICVAQPL